MSATTRARPVGLAAEAAEAFWQCHTRDCAACAAGRGCTAGQAAWARRAEARAELRAEREERGRATGAE